MTQLESAILQAINEDIKHHAADMEVRVKAVESALEDLMSAQRTLQRKYEALLEASSIAVRCITFESMHHEQGMKMRLLRIANDLNRAVNPDWVMP